MARAAYNYALARKIAAYDAFRERRVPTEAGLDVAVAEDQAKIEPALPRSKTNVGVWRKEWKSRESQWDERVAQLVGQGIPRDETQRIAGQELRMLGWGVAEDGQLIDCYTRQASSYSVHSAMQDADRSGESLSVVGILRACRVVMGHRG